MLFKSSMASYEAPVARHRFCRAGKCWLTHGGNARWASQRRFSVRVNPGEGIKLVGKGSICCSRRLYLGILDLCKLEIWSKGEAVRGRVKTG